MPLQIRRGPTADRLSITPLIGELVYDTTTSTVYVGDGSTPGGIAATNFTEEDARLATARTFLGTLLSDNSRHSGITFSWDGSRLDASISDTLEGSFKGSLFAEDSGLIIDAENHIVYGSLVGSVFGDDSSGPLVNAQDGSINLNGTVKGNIVPDANEVYDIGSSTLKFRDLYLSGTSIYIGDALITSDGSAVNLPSGSQIGELPVVVSGGDVQSVDINGSVFSDDSTLLIDGTNGSINLIGTVKDDIIPDETEIRNLGSFDTKFSRLFLSESSDAIYIGNAVIGSFGSIIELPAGSTVGGVPIGSGSGTGDGIIPGSNYNINIVADDSTVIVNSFSKQFNGEFFGNITGSVLGNVTGNLQGDVTGNVTGNLQGNVTGNVSGSLDGTVIQSNQSNITEVGTLSFLNVSGTTTIIGDVNADRVFADDIFGRVYGSVVGVDSTLLVDSVNSRIPAEVVKGLFTGDVKGSVFADDSTAFIDAVDKKIFVSSVTVNSDLVIENGTITNNNVNSVVTFNETAIEAKTDASTVQSGIRSTGITNGVFTTAVTAMYGSRGTLSAPTIVNLNDNYAGVLVAGHNNSSYVESGAILFSADASPSPGDPSISTKFSVIVADGSGTLFASFKQMSFDSAGTLSAPVIQTGTYTLSPDTRPAAPSAGMIIFVSDASSGSKFQGWDGGSWVSLG